MTFQGRCGVVYLQSYELSGFVYNEKTRKIEVCVGMTDIGTSALLSVCEFCLLEKTRVERAVQGQLDEVKRLEAGFQK